MEPVAVDPRKYDYLPQREGILFTVRITDVKEAAERQLAYHAKRAAHWQKRLTKAKAALRKSTRLEEVPVTGGTQTVIRTSPEVERELRLAGSKLEGHRAEADVFREWVALFEAQQGKETVRINHTDAAFFRLSGHTPE